VALSRGVSPRPQAFVAQADAQPFAALLDAAVSPVPDSGAGAPVASGYSDQPQQANTGVAAQGGGAAASPSAASAGSTTQASGAPDNSAPAQSGDASATNGAAADNTGDHQPVPAPDANDSLNLARATPANGMPIQITNADGADQIAAKTGGAHKPGFRLDMPATNEPVITMPVPLRSLGGNPNSSSGTSANRTRDGAMPFANDPAASPVGADVSKNTPDNTAAAAVAAVLADIKSAGSADGAAPGATKPPADGKAEQKDQENGAADTATALPAANQPQLSSPAPAQPVAAAVTVNVAPDPAPPAAAKPGLAIADAVKARTKGMLTSTAMPRTTPTQDDSTDAPGSGPAVDSGGANDSAATSGSDDTSGNAPAANAPQAMDQLQTPGADGLAFLSQIDFASLGGTEHFSLRGETVASPNAGAGPAAPNAIANTATAPTFGIFAPNAIATNGAAPAAAASDPAVPLAGLAVAIAGRAQAGSSQFDIRLDPPELGRIDVRLDVDGTGQVRTHVTVDRPDTLQLLQSQQPQLERALEQAGLKTADNGLQFTLRDQSFAGQNGGTGGQHYTNQSAAPLVIPDVDAAPIDTAQIYARLRLGNGLDISV
jgi:flagellar hook-length control protein FliK